MDSKDILNLQEAYMEVVENQQLDEGKVELDKERRTRMGRQIGKKVRSAEAEYSLSKDTMYPKGLRGAMERGARKKVGQAQKIMGALKSAQKEQVDIYDIILSHLLDEGYAETPEQAEAIMVNMSEEWREEIVEAKKWIQQAIKKPGAFTKKAKAHKMTPSQFKSEVQAHPEKYPTKTERQANLMGTLGKLNK